MQVIEVIMITDRTMLEGIITLLDMSCITMTEKHCG